MKFYNINSKDVETHSELFASMHHLRWQAFYKNLGWRNGLNSVNGFEFDQYDNEDAQHIIMVDDTNKVQASCRLLPTTVPYMIGDHCQEHVSEIPMPHTDKIWEISRFTCASNVPGFRGLALTGHLAAAIIEFGLCNNISQFIAWTTTDIKALITRAGWDPKPVGPERDTNEGKPSVICLYSSNRDMLQTMRNKHNIDAPLLHSTQNPDHPMLRELHSPEIRFQACYENVFSRSYFTSNYFSATREESSIPLQYILASKRASHHDCTFV